MIGLFEFFGWIAFLWVIFCLVVIPVLELGGHISRKHR